MRRAILKRVLEDMNFSEIEFMLTKLKMPHQR